MKDRAFRSAIMLRPTDGYASPTTTLVTELIEAIGDAARPASINWSASFYNPRVRAARSQPCLSTEI